MKEKHTYRHTDASGSLPQGLRVNPYTVPDGYFEHLPRRTMLNCQRDEAATPMGVPAGYFEQLTDSITARIAEQKLKATVDRSGFLTPEGYFGELEQRVIAECNGLPTSPVRKLSRQKWVAYAAAASIALVLGIAGMLRLANDAPETQSPLASVPDQQILDYLELYGAPNDMMYISEQLDDFDERQIGEEISDEDIEAYLNHTL